MASIRISKTLTYLAPDGTRTTPSLEQLGELIFRTPDKYWKRGNQNGCLEYARKRGKGFVIENGKPSPMFSRLGRHGFFVMHFDPASNIAVPFAGGESTPWVKHFDGQLTWYVPRACMISPAFAWEVVLTFLRSDGRSDTVPWVDKDSIEFRTPGCGDDAPKGKDLA